MPRPWNGTLVIEDEQTGDGRVFAAGALTWADPPLPLAWLADGDQHVGLSEVAPVVGTIETLSRVGDEIRATGVIDDSVGTAGAQMLAQMDAGTAPFGAEMPVSVDVDDWAVQIIDTDPLTEEEMGLLLASGATSRRVLLAEGTGAVRFKVRFAAAGDPDPGEPTDEGDSELLMEEAADTIIERFTAGRIRGATCCAVPAFDRARIRLGDLASQAVAAAGVPGPPLTHFTNPNLEDPQRWVTVDDDGRVTGHLALWGECHIGFVDTCLTPETLMAGGYDWAMPGHVVCAEGTRVATGPIAVKGGHAGTTADWDWRRAQAHYDDPATAVCDVTYGADGHGVWFSGALRPNASDDMVHALRASGVSGDWREIGGQLRLVGACSVNVPGFQKPEARIADGRIVAYVAAGGQAAPDDCGCHSQAVQAAALDRRLALLEPAMWGALDARMGVPAPSGG